MLKVALLALLLGSMGCLPGRAAEAKRPEVWLTHYHPERLVSEHLEWDFVRRHLYAMEFYLNAVAYLTPRDELAVCLKELRASGIKVAVECGHFDWRPLDLDFSKSNPRGISEKPREKLKPGVGAETAKDEIAKLTNLQAAYGPPDYLVLDGPIRRLAHPQGHGHNFKPDSDVKGFERPEEVAAEIAGYMRTWQAKYPKVQFILLTNFPNWGWKGGMAYWGSGPEGQFFGDYYVWLKGVLHYLEAQGLTPAGIRADSPYEHTKGTYNIYGTPWPVPIKDPATIDWMARLLDLERFVHRQHLRFGLIVNSDKGGNTSSEAFCRRSLAYLDWYLASGGKADRYIVQSWYKYPDKEGPETEPYTMAWLVKQFIAKLQPVARPQPAGDSG